MYLAITQSLCNMFLDNAACEAAVGGARMQPRSALLQWDRYTQQFTELHSITQQMNQLLRGSPVPATEVLVHQFAFRIPAGRANAAESFQVPAVHRMLLHSRILCSRAKW